MRKKHSRTKKEKQIAYFNSNNAAVEMLKGKEKLDRLVFREEIVELRDFFYKEWEKWYADNIVEPKGGDGEEPFVQEDESFKQEKNN